MVGHSKSTHICQVSEVSSLHVWENSTSRQVPGWSVIVPCVPDLLALRRQRAGKMRERKERGSFLQRDRLHPKVAMPTPAAAGSAAGDREIWASGSAVVLGSGGQAGGRGAGWAQRTEVIRSHAAPVALSIQPHPHVHAPPP